MANLTLTSSQVNNGPVSGDQPGLNYVYQKIVWGTDIRSKGSLSASVVLQVLAVPDGARILGLSTMVTGAANQVGNYGIGDGSSTSRFVTTLSITASDVVSGFGLGGAAATSLNVPGVGVRYSMTQSDFVQFESIDMSFRAVTSTMSLCIDMVAFYIIDRENTGEV